MLKNDFLAILNRRHACHSFTAQALAPDAVDFILEAGRLSPSSFGLEPWHFVVCTRTEDKQKLQAACFDQLQVGQAATVIVILARLSELAPDHPYAQELLQREYPGERFAGGMAMYRDFYAAIDVPAWSTTQCHIAAANMMTAAAAIDVDSCPIGGFLPDAVGTTLNLPREQFVPALILALGHCQEPVPSKQRLPLAQLVTRR